ncbi:hypothetical protein AAVH_17703 [Aphelenchoides avenae]|nr:hypothetical protein AAVH_17703 [Aphelenchus avenae]
MLRAARAKKATGKKVSVLAFVDLECQEGRSGDKDNDDGMMRTLPAFPEEEDLDRYESSFIDDEPEIPQPKKKKRKNRKRVAFSSESE